MKKILKIFIDDIIYFVNFYLKNNKQQQNNRILSSLVVLLLLSILGTFINVLGALFLGAIDYQKPFFTNEIIQTINLHENMYIIVIPCIFAPIFEELGYRLPQKKSFINLFIAILSFIIAIKFISQSKVVLLLNGNFIEIIKSINLYDWRLIPFLFILLKILFQKLFKNRTKFDEDAIDYSIIIVTSIFFALAHNQFPFTLHNSPWIIFAIIPYFFHGLYYSFIYNKFGIKRAILIHIIWNTIFIVPSALFNI